MTEPTNLPSWDDERLQEQLRNLPAEPMPAEVWAQLQAAIAAEQDGREAARPARRTRWLAIAGAAAAVVIVGGLVIGTNRTPTPAPVAANAPATLSTEQQSAIANADPSSARIVTAGFAPARKVMASHTNYEKSHLREQVASLLAGVGVDDPSDVASMPQASTPETVGTTGFTATVKGLRDCLTSLTKNAAAQALVVDRALFEGLDAGVLVMPTGTAAEGTPAPTLTAGPLDVWVVDPACDVLNPHVMLHTSHDLHHMATPMESATP